MKKVLLFGTFDGIHPGHHHMFSQAREHGDHISVIVARDQTVLKVKSRYPDNDELSRLRALQNHEHVDHAQLGSLTDKYAAILDLAPHIICLGYDQQTFVDGLTRFIAQQNLEITVVRLVSFKPEIYKSSLLRKKKKEM